MSEEYTLTPEQQLAQVNDAIRAILVTGQEIWHEGRRIHRADLAVLVKHQQQLKTQIAAAAGDATTVAVFEGR